MNQSLKAIVERCEGCEWILDPANLEPIIRELCEVVEIQQKALELYASCPQNSGVNEAIINGGEYIPLGTVARNVLDSTTKRLEQLGLGEGK